MRWCTLTFQWARGELGAVMRAPVSFFGGGRCVSFFAEPTDANGEAIDGCRLHIYCMEGEKWGVLEIQWVERRKDVTNSVELVDSNASPPQPQFNARICARSKSFGLANFLKTLPVTVSSTRRFPARTSPPSAAPSTLYRATTRRDRSARPASPAA